MMKIHALRLRPGEDPVIALETLAQEQQFEAACIVTGVGSLRRAVLRFANQEQAVALSGHFEIVSLTGVFSRHGGHYHIAIADREGHTTGGHLMQGSEVYTTAEIVLVEVSRLSFQRAFDPSTGYPELVIQPTNS